MTSLDPFVVDYTFLVVPVREDVQDALSEWIRSKHLEVDEVLKPFGLRAAELELPDFRRLLGQAEIRARLDGRWPLPESRKEGPEA